MEAPVSTRTRHCTGVILAGGLASRMQGEAKGLLTIGGRSIVESVATALRSACDDLCLAVGDVDVPEALPGASRVRDVFPGVGPLAGIHAALAVSGTDVMACAWDMPHVSASLLGELRGIGESGFDLVIPCSDDAHLEPLCAWYAAATLPLIERTLRLGKSSVVGLARVANAYIVPIERVREFGDPRVLFLNINSPDDLARARSSSLESTAR